MLVTRCGRAVWGTLDQDHVDHEWPDAWLCTIFRNEGAGLSSELITEAVQAVRERWGGPPVQGMITFVDPAKVRHKRDPGRCFLKAGFVKVGMTKGGHGRNPLVVLQLRPEDWPDAQAAWSPSMSLPFAERLP